MSNLTGVANFFSTVNEGFSTALNGTISAGATTVPLESTTGLTDGSVFVGIIEPGAVNQQVFTGSVNLTSQAIVNVIWTRGTNVPHAGGVTIVDYVTGTDFNMMSTGMQVEHAQSGKHTAAAAITLGKMLWPVGAIYTEITGTNPGTTFGFGTWVSFATGQALIGVDTGQTEFNTVAKTGGAKTVNASHTHLVYSTMGISSNNLLPIRPDSIPGSSIDTIVTDTVGQVIGAQATGVELWQYPTLNGGNTALPTLPPYITVYFWKRTV